MALFFIPKAAPVSGGENYAQCKLYFYATGTSTAALVYTDSALTTAHSQPVVADAGGVFAPIYVDPAVSYRVVLRSSGGSLIWDVDPFPSSTLTQAQIAGTLWPRTALEISAGVTPTDYAYPPLDVRRYGATGNGSSDDTAAIQLAIDVAEANTAAGGGAVYFPTTPRYYRTTSPLLITENGIVLYGDGAASGIYNSSSGNVINITGTSDVHLVGLNITTGPASTSCVSLDTALNTRIERCLFSTSAASSNGITSTGSYCCTVINCTFGSITGWGIYASESANAWYIAGNRLDGATIAATGGILVYGNGNCLLGNTIETFDICVQLAGNGIQCNNYLESYRIGYNFPVADTGGVQIGGSFNSFGCATSIVISAGIGYTINDCEFVDVHTSGAPIELTTGAGDVFIGPNIKYADDYAVDWPINHIEMRQHLLTEIIKPLAPGALTAVTHTGTTGATVIKTSTLTKEHLGTGTHITVTAAGTIAGTAGTKSMVLKFGSYAMATVSEASGATDDWIIEAKIDILSASVATGSVVAYQGAALEAVDVFSTSAIDLTATDPTVTLTATLGAAGDSIVLTQWRVHVSN